jgi:hypothetical protein
MEIQKCYSASFNVGAIGFWGSEIYLDKNSVLLEIENSFEEIAEALEKFSLHYTICDDDYSEVTEMFQRAVKDLKKYGSYEERDNELDFFILEQPVWKNYQQKNELENAHN